MAKDNVRTARAKGASEPRVIGWHAFRNTLVPLVTVLGLEVGYLLAGALYVVTVFGISQKTAPGPYELDVVALGVHAKDDVTDPAPGVKPAMQRPPLGRVAETRGKQCPETGDENAAVHRYDRSVNHIC